MRILSGLNRGYEASGAEVSKTKTPESIDYDSRKLSLNLRGFALTLALASVLGPVASSHAKDRYPIKGGAASTVLPQPPGTFDARQEISRVKLMQFDPRVVSVDQVMSDDEVLYNAQSKCGEPFENMNVRFQRNGSRLIADIGATAVVSRGTTVWYGQANVPGYEGPVVVGEPFDAQCTSIVDIRRRIAIYRSKKMKNNTPPQRVSYMTRLSDKSILPKFPQVSDPSIQVVQNDAAVFTNVPKASRRYDYWFVLDTEVKPNYPTKVADNMPEVGGRKKIGFRLGRKSNFNITKSRPDTIFVK